MPRLCSDSSRSYPGRSARQGREARGEVNDQSGHWRNKPGRRGGAAIPCERTGISEYYRPIPEIDHWLRRRIRMCYWKQWRYARTKVRELLKLGTYLKAAIFVAISRKGPWHLARTLATQTGMTNQ
jgi:hypothetical protein